MSIIYEALKKVDDAHKEASQPETVKENRRASSPKIKIIILSLLLISLLYFFVVPLAKTKIFSGKTTDLIPVVTQAIKPEPLPQAPAEPIPPSPAAAEVVKAPAPLPLILNGVFFSDDHAYALINNRILKEGDTIEGALLKRIDHETQEVELERFGSVIKLTTQ